MFMDEVQRTSLERLHRETKVPVSELIRRAVDRFLTETRKGQPYPNADEATERLLSVAGVCEGGPKDLADSHDAYLHGFLKK